MLRTFYALYLLSSYTFFSRVTLKDDSSEQDRMLKPQQALAFPD